MTISGAVHYGEVLSFTPPAANFSQGSFFDERTGKTYRTVTIEGQTHINDDVVMNNSVKYDWYEACDYAPPGWHVPSVEEVEQLRTSVGPLAAGAAPAFAHPELVNTPIIDGRFPESLRFWTSTFVSDADCKIFYIDPANGLGVRIGNYGGDLIPAATKGSVRYFKD